MLNVSTTFSGNEREVYYRVRASNRERAQCEYQAKNEIQSHRATDAHTHTFIPTRQLKRARNRSDLLGSIYFSCETGTSTATTQISSKRLTNKQTSGSRRRKIPQKSNVLKTMSGKFQIPSRRDTFFCCCQSRVSAVCSFNISLSASLRFVSQMMMNSFAEYSFPRNSFKFNVSLSF